MAKYTIDELIYSPTFAEAALAYYLLHSGVWKDLNTAQISKIKSNMFDGLLGKQQAGELRGLLNPNRDESE